MNILIVGYGRAGKRHAKIVEKLGHFWLAVDPSIQATKVFNTLDSALAYKLIDEKYGSFDLAVICTPPGLHISQAQTCLDAGLHVLIEKPLCGRGQLDKAEKLLYHPRQDRVMMALNYRWHPAIKGLRQTRGIDWNEDWAGQWQAHSEQHRQTIPEWGILLDHAAHTIDIIRHLSGYELQPSFTSQDNDRRFGISGRLSHPSATFLMSDWADRPGQKVAYIKGPFGRVDIPTLPWELDQMFGGMWGDVLAWVRGEIDNPCPLADGYLAQVVLERARKLL